MAEKPEIEVIPPDPDLIDIEGLTTERDRVKGMALVTVGQIKREMGTLYRLTHRGRIQWAVATRAVWLLRQMLKACEIEQRYFLPPAPDADDTPAFGGLNIIGPTVALLAGAPRPQRRQARGAEKGNGK